MLLVLWRWTETLARGEMSSERGGGGVGGEKGVRERERVSERGETDRQRD